MKRLLFAGTILASVGATHANAAVCTILPGSGPNFQWLSCQSDQQANDGDDQKVFVDKAGAFTTAGGSVGANVNTDDNVDFTSSGPAGATNLFSTDGSGFANFKSENDDISGYTTTGNIGSTMPIAPGVFPGFDGELFRGQLTNNTVLDTSWNGDVSVVVKLSDGTTEIQTFTGFKDSKDIGVLGFDEVNDPGVLVTSVFAYAGDVDSLGNPLLAGEGAWEEYKQIEVSVPGTIAIVPEPSTWAMMLLGFAGLAYAGYRKTKSPRMIFSAG